MLLNFICKAYEILIFCNFLLAQDAGRFKAEIAPVTVTEKRKEVKVEVDEHPRPQTTLEGLAKLPTLFKKNGLVTAGTASVSYFFRSKLKKEI